MKSFITCAVLLCSATAYADTYYEEAPPPRRVVVTPRYVEPHPYIRSPGWEWRAAHRERNSGLAMTVVGIPFAIAATSLALWAPNTVTRYDYNTAIAGAVITGVTAGLLIIPGIPLWADGQARIDALEGRHLSLKGGAGGAPGSSLALSF